MFGPPPLHADIRRRLHARLHALSPRAFELFAGELLTFVGLQQVAVTRYRGDGGIDAHGDLVSSSDFVRVPTGVQVKRHTQNIGRPDIDRFIGALGGHFRHGIFMTTSDYAPQARLKAQTSPLLRVDTINGDQIVTLMGRHQLGTSAASDLDEDFFLAFEAQATQRTTQIADPPASYTLAPESGVATRPEDDIISMHALGYELRVDPYTIQDWVRNGRLLPDRVVPIGQRESYFFRRDRLDAIRNALQLDTLPHNGVEWRQAFLDFAKSRSMTRSYKPVLLLVLLQFVDRRGEAQMTVLAQAFREFYCQRQREGLPTETNGPLADPAQASLDTVRRVIITHPLERFRLQHYLEYDSAADVVRFTPQLWHELRAYELLDLRASAEDQLRYYYGRKPQ